MRCKRRFKDNVREAATTVRGAVPQRARVHPLVQLSSLVGNHACTQLIQAKLANSRPGNVNKKEARLLGKPADEEKHGATTARRDAIYGAAPQLRHGRGGPLSDYAHSFVEPRFGFDLNHLRVNPDASANAIQSQPSGHQPRFGAFRLFSGQSDCSPTWFGDTSPETDPSGGSFTGKLKVTYNDAELKDPCVRECVEQHEAVHVRDLTPIVKKIHDCDVAAGNDWDKKGKCNEMATRELNAARSRSECNAYRASFTCLTLKVLDSSNKCSKSPHREQVQKHRGYDGCELKRHCNEAGTPELGIPNA